MCYHEFTPLLFHFWASIHFPRLGSSSSALVSEVASPGGTAFLAKKRGEGGHDHDTGNGDGRSKKKPVGKEKTAKAKAKAKAKAISSRVENNCTGVDGGDNKEGDGVAANGSVGSSGKKRRSPAVLMEGSRCSRVNGRGWRCCQQTLVGYSLCEHHLGKGRLRSMSSVRVQAGGNKSKKSSERRAEGELPSESSPQEEEEEEEEKKARDKQCLGVDNGEEDIEDEKQQARRKKKKIGMVKARTISSLLDDTNHSVEPTLSPSSPLPPPPPPLPLKPASMQEGETIV